MARATSRRPVPALVFLLALAVLTAVVWIRVLHRDDTARASEACPPDAAVLPQPRTVSLQVLNSTQTNDLAHKVQKQLTIDGFHVSNVGNDEPTINGVAEIRYGPPGLRAAQLVSYYVPGAKLVPADLTGSAIVLSLGTTFRKLATPALVHHSISVARISQEPAAGAKATASASPSASAPASCTATPSP